MRKIIIGLSILLAVFIGYTIVRSWNSSSGETFQPTLQKNCPESTSSAEFSYKDKKDFVMQLNKSDGQLASISAALEIKKQSTPPPDVVAESYEQFQARIIKLKPNTDLVKHDVLIRQNYQEYLTKLEATNKKYNADFYSKKQKLIEVGELAINLLKEYKSEYEKAISKLENCETINRDEFNEKIRQLNVTYETLK